MALPPRRKRGVKRPAVEAEEEITTYAERAIENAAKVDQAVAARSACSRAKPLDTSSRSEGNYEHLDHTADVQFHAWGSDLQAAFSALGNCFFDYVTQRSTIQAIHEDSFTVDATDLHALVFRFLDELLFRFSADGLVCANVTITQLERGETNTTKEETNNNEIQASNDRKPWKITVHTIGENFDLSKHPQGTEVKAITYSNMQVHRNDDRTDIFVIVDI